MHVSEKLIKEFVVVVEWKHIFGMVFNEEGSLKLEDEIAIFQRVQKKI